MRKQPLVAAQHRILHPGHFSRSTLPSWAYRFRRSFSALTRRPYGGLVTTQPGPGGGSTAEIARWENSIEAEIPARAALPAPSRSRRGRGRSPGFEALQHMAPRPDRRLRPSRTLGCRGRSPAPRGIRSIQAFEQLTVEIRPVHKGESSVSSGARSFAKSAASIGIVPDPQNGSSSGETRSHPDPSSIAACQGLAQRRLRRGQPVAPAVEVLAGGIDAHGRLVLLQAHDHELRQFAAELLVKPGGAAGSPGGRRSPPAPARRPPRNDTAATGGRSPAAPPVGREQESAPTPVGPLSCAAPRRPPRKIHPP